jgi:hypothetical protein
VHVGGLAGRRCGDRPVEHVGRDGGSVGHRQPVLGDPGRGIRSLDRLALAGPVLVVLAEVDDDLHTLGLQRIDVHRGMRHPTCEQV